MIPLFLTAVIAATLFFGRVAARPNVFTVVPRDVSAAADNDFWYPKMAHLGNYFGQTTDIGDNGYSVYYDTVPENNGDYIQVLINYSDNGGRNGGWLASQPRVSCLLFRSIGTIITVSVANSIGQIVYLRSGEYTIDKTLHMSTDTILMGDATDVSDFIHDEQCSRANLCSLLFSRPRQPLSERRSFFQGWIRQSGAEERTRS